MRLLFLSNKAANRQEEEASLQAYQDCKAFLQQHRPGYVLVSALDDYNQRITEVRHWPGWIKAVSTGQLGPGDPVYHGYICETAMVGQANKQIVQSAIDNNKPVFVWGVTGFKRVSCVADQRNPNSVLTPLILQ